MHDLQSNIIGLLKDQGSIPLKYREIGRRIGAPYPQAVKHHIEKLKKNGLIEEKNGFLSLVQQEESEDFLKIPFYGLANCGEPTAWAEDNIKGYIKISRNILPRRSLENIYLLEAFGNSMNQAKVRGQSIENGDLVLIDAEQRAPQNNDYIVAIIDDCGTIKRYKELPAAEQVALVADSTDDYLPIILHEADDFHVVGKVVGVIKRN